MQALQFALVAVDHLGEQHHHTPSSQRSWKPSSSISMRSLLLWRTTWVMKLREALPVHARADPHSRVAASA